jgi:ABC-type microcin C transport system permease subunit YejB
MATTLYKPIVERSLESQWHRLMVHFERVSEYFWFLVSFVLFVVLGPFSAPVVLLVLCRLGLQENDHVEPEPASSR